MALINGNKTYDQIVSGLSKMVRELDSLITTQQEKAQSKRVEIANLAAQADQHEREADRAKMTKTRISDLLGE